MSECWCPNLPTARIAASQGASNDERRAELLHGATMVAKAKEGFSSAGDVVGDVKPFYEIIHGILNHFQVRVKDCLYLLARLYHHLNLHQVIRF